jgi:hypothetical protein
VLAFLWLELAYHEPGSPRAIGVALLVAPVVLLGFAARRGRQWLRVGDPLAALFGVLGAMAPFWRDERGNLRMRLPGVGLTALEPRAGTTALVLVVLGGTTFDGVARTAFWGDVTVNRSGWSLTALNTVGLVWFIGCVAVLYLGATRVMANAEAGEPTAVADRFIHSLVPIALGYTIAHYFSLLVFEGQRFIIVLSDPAGMGWNLLGTATWRVDYRLIAPSTIAWVQIAAIVGGHLLGVVLAHDRALEHGDVRTATRRQYPLLAAMVVYTVGALVLLLNA